MARQKLLTKEILKNLPPLYSQEDLGDDAIVYAKFFCPWNRWTWYATEYNPKDGVFFGLVKGQEDELGYFTLEDLTSVVGPFGLYIERDTSFKPTKISELRS